MTERPVVRREDLERAGTHIGQEYAHDLKSNWDAWNAAHRGKGRRRKAQDPASKKAAAPASDSPAAAEAARGGASAPPAATGVRESPPGFGEGPTIGKPHKRIKGIPSSVSEEMAWSAPPTRLPDNFKGLPDPERDALAQAATTVPERVAALTTLEPWPNSGSDERDITDRLQQVKDKVTPESSRMISGFAVDVMNRIKAVSGGTLTPEGRALSQLMTDSVIAQEVEAATRVLGDHGVHHLAGNDRMGQELLAAMHEGQEASPEDSLALSMVAAFHDTGYLTPPARAWQDKDHPRWSQQHFDANVAPLLAKVMGAEAAKNVSRIIGEHSGTTLDWKGDPLLATVQMADNMALFSKEKTPPLFRVVPNAREIMGRLTDAVASAKATDDGTPEGNAAATAAGKVAAKRAQAELVVEIKKSSLSDPIKSQLLRAASEVAPLLPEFIGGMWNGEVTSIEWDKATHSPVVNVRNLGNNPLMKAIDMGQGQFDKMARTFGGSLEAFKKATRLRDAQGRPLGSQEVVFGDPPKMKIRVFGKLIMRRDVHGHLVFDLVAEE